MQLRRNKNPAASFVVESTAQNTDTIVELLRKSRSNKQIPATLFVGFEKEMKFSKLENIFTLLQASFQTMHSRFHGFAVGQQDENNRISNDLCQLSAALLDCNAQW